MKVELNDNGIFINGHEVALPTSVDKLSQILGEPSRRFYDRDDWRAFWDELGLYVSGIDIINLMFVTKPQDGFTFPPEQFFKGEIFVNGKPIQDYAERVTKVNKYQINQARFMGEETNPIFGYMIGKNYDYKEVVDENKYAFQKISGTPIIFEDFNFKLAVIEELMYQQEVLTPKFDIHEFAKWYKGRTIDVEKEGHEPIPEAVEYFKNLEIDEKLAKKVKSLEQDGGNDIYMNIAPYWSGEDETFTIKSFDDVASFPNLKEMTLLYDERGDKVLETLKEKGIEADWL